MTDSPSVVQNWRALCVLLLIAATVILAVLMLMRYVFPEPPVYGWCCMEQGSECRGNTEANACISGGGFAFAMNEATCLVTCDSPSLSYGVAESQ